jgi:hypothetical protein
MARTRKNKRRGFFGFSFFRKKNDDLKATRRENDKKIFKDNLDYFVKDKCIPYSLYRYFQTTRKACSGVARNVFSECRRVKRLPKDIHICRQKYNVEEERPVEEPIQDHRGEEWTVNKILAMMNFYKEINGIKFCAIAFVRANETESYPFRYDEYDKMRVVSIDQKGIQRFFWTYQSNSELGMWRWCSGTEKKDKTGNTSTFKFNKIQGVPFNDNVYGDYVQTTLLHIELQFYLNEIKNSPGHREMLLSITRSLTENRTIPLDGLKRYTLIPFEKMVDYKTTCNDFLAGIKTMTKTQKKDLGTLILPITREIQTPPFNMFNAQQQCGKPVDSSVLEAFSTQFAKDYEVVSYNILFENYKYHQHVEYLDRGEISETHVEGDINQFILRRKDSSPAEDPRVNLIKLIYLETNEIILNAKKRFFTRDQTSKSSWLSPTVLVSTTGMPIRRKTYHMPIALIPIIEGVAECNAYGLYSHYIQAGQFICKLFDYVEQCSLDESKRKTCLGKYVFIGDRYNGLFPFTLTPDQLERLLDQPIAPLTSPASLTVPLPSPTTSATPSANLPAPPASATPSANLPSPPASATPSANLPAPPASATPSANLPAPPASVTPSANRPAPPIPPVPTVTKEATEPQEGGKKPRYRSRLCRKNQRCTKKKCRRRTDI